MRFFRFIILLAFICTQGPDALAQRERGPANPVEAAAVEHALSEAEIQGLIGKSASLLMQDGRTFENVVISGFKTGREKDRIKILEGTIDDDRRTFPAKQLFSITIGETNYRVNFLPSLKAAAIENSPVRQEQVEARLRDQGHKLWQPFSEEEQKQFVDEEKAFLQKVVAYFQRLPLQLHETNYFLFLTDMPTQQVAPYLLQLDRMYETLGRAFGYPPGHNIWRGKAVIIVFLDRIAFQAFEAQFMGATGIEGVQGLCHSYNSGRVVISCWRGDDPNFFGGVLVHETSHGYMHRYLSTVPIPLWVNEGIAEWVAQSAVPQCTEMNRRRVEAAQRLQQSGTFGGVYFNADHLDRWQYGAAHSMVDMLIRENPEQFRLFFNGIKEGYAWETSLQRAYGISVGDLTQYYGRSIGVPLLTP